MREPLWLAADADEIVRQGRAIIDGWIAQRPGQPVRPPLDAPGLTLAEYAHGKKLSADFLQDLGLRDGRYCGLPCVVIPHFDQRGRDVATQFRIALDGPDRFRWKRGAKRCPYGVWKLWVARFTGYLAITEGPSDVHTCWSHAIPSLGTPGCAWSPRWTPYMERIDRVFVVVEPGGSGESLVRSIAKAPFRARARLVHLDPFKDPSAMHIADPEHFVERFRAALDTAEPL
jgi:hypothetical protein